MCDDHLAWFLHLSIQLIGRGFSYHWRNISIQIIESTNILIVICLILFLSVVGQVGDLFFSAIKRENKVKDFSNLIPGHGGILDRLDSIIFVMFAFIIIISYL